MNRSDLIRMAREAGLYIGTNLSTLLLVGHREPGQTFGLNHISIEELERFYAIAIAAEREACIRIIEEHQISVGNSPVGEMACELTYDALKEIRAAIRAREQEQPR